MKRIGLRLVAAFVKTAILTRSPEAASEAHYELRWVERGGGRYRKAAMTLTFVREDKGYKFTGALMGPSEACH